MNKINTSTKKQFKRIVKFQLDYCINSLKTLSKLKDLENKL